MSSINSTLDGSTIITGGYDRCIGIWDIKTGDCFKTIEGHTDYINSVQITRDGKKIVSGSHDKTLRVWDINTGTCIACYQAGSEVCAISEIDENACFGFGTWAGDVIFLAPLNFGL